MTTLLELGRVGRAHGIRGDVLVTLLTERTERLAPGSVLHAGGETLTVEASRRHQDRWIVHFEGVGDRSAAEALRGRALCAEAVEEDDEDPEELWVHRVVGARLRTVEGRWCGTVVAVQANPAHDLLELDDGTLVPAVFVVGPLHQEADGSRVVVVDVPDGLLPDEPGA